MRDVAEEFTDRSFLRQGEVKRLELPIRVPSASGNLAPGAIRTALACVDMAVNLPRKGDGRELMRDFSR